jgi:hypothetical protein
VVPGRRPGSNLMNAEAGWGAGAVSILCSPPRLWSQLAARLPLRWRWAPTCQRAMRRECQGGGRGEAVRAAQDSSRALLPRPCDPCSPAPLAFEIAFILPRRATGRISPFGSPARTQKVQKRPSGPGSGAVSGAQAATSSSYYHRGRLPPGGRWRSRALIAPVQTTYRGCCLGRTGTW